MYNKIANAKNEGKQTRKVKKQEIKRKKESDRTITDKNINGEVLRNDRSRG